MASSRTKEFNKFQEIFFPIHKYELKKFLPMSMLMFCMLFVYNLVRNLKDWFIQYSSHLWVSARPEESANLISALKFWYVLPCAFLMVLLFTVLVNKFGHDKTFYIMLSGFMAFYFLYGYFIYPNLDRLIMSPEDITNLINVFPPFFRSFMVCMCNWPLTLFYIVSELWGTMAISSLFWQFANRVTMAHEVKRFFALLSLLSNFGTIIAGSTILKYANNLDIEHVRLLMTVVIAIFVAALSLYTYINRVVLKDPLFYDASKVVEKKKKGKVSALEGVKVLLKNRYLLLIASLVMCYGVAINFFEVLMKANMKETFSGQQYAQIQGILTVFTGIFATIVTLISSYILRKFSWKVAALVTPVLLIVLGGAFLVVLLYKQFVSASIFGCSAALIAAWFGILNNAFVKSVKYSLFDTTKSMAYLPLSEDERTKGQAAVEIIGARAGKAGSSLVQQIMVSFPRTLVTVTGSVAGILAYTPSIIAIFFSTIVIWILSVLSLSKKYESKMAQGKELT